VKRDPRDDTEVYSIGTILVKMRATTRESLEAVLREQSRMTEDELVGALLVRAGIITEEQLEVALSAQAGLRSSKPHVRALAAADLACRSSEKVRSLAGLLRRAVSEVRKKRTGEEFPAVQMLGKKDTQ